MSYGAEFKQIFLGVGGNLSTSVLYIFWKHRISIFATQTLNCISIVWNTVHSGAARIWLVLHPRQVYGNHVLLLCVYRQNDASCDLVCRSTSIVEQLNVLRLHLLTVSALVLAALILGRNISRRGFHREWSGRNSVQIRWAVNVMMIGLVAVIMKLMT